MNRIMIIAAHGDDEILGCGGTVAKMINEGAEACTLILGEGITSRDNYNDSDIDNLKTQMAQANRTIGIKTTFLHNLPDNKFDSLPLLEIVKIIEKCKSVIKPNIIFTHFAGDLNIDHQITNKAVLTATRPMSGETVKEIYAFEILSSTEWNFPLSFQPDYFINITDTLAIKITAMEKYKSEIRQYPHPRSKEGIALNAEYWGMRTGLGYAEAFQTLRRLQ